MPQTNPFHSLVPRKLTDSELARSIRLEHRGGAGRHQPLRRPPRGHRQRGGQGHPPARDGRGARARRPLLAADCPAGSRAGPARSRGLAEVPAHRLGRLARGGGGGGRGWREQWPPTRPRCPSSSRWAVCAAEGAASPPPCARRAGPRDPTPPCRRRCECPACPGTSPGPPCRAAALLSRACSGKLATPTHVVRVSDSPSRGMKMVRLHGAADALGHLERSARVRASQQHHVLVAAVAHDHVPVSHAALQHTPHLHQQLASPPGGHACR